MRIRQAAAAASVVGESMQWTRALSCVLACCAWVACRLGAAGDASIDAGAAAVSSSSSSSSSSSGSGDKQAGAVGVLPSAFRAARCNARKAFLQHHSAAMLAAKAAKQAMAAAAALPGTDVDDEEAADAAESGGDEEDAAAVRSAKRTQVQESTRMARMARQNSVPAVNQGAAAAAGGASAAAAAGEDEAGADDQSLCVCMTGCCCAPTPCAHAAAATVHSAAIACMQAARVCVGAQAAPQHSSSGYHCCRAHCIDSGSGSSANTCAVQHTPEVCCQQQCCACKCRALTNAAASNAVKPTATRGSGRKRVSAQTRGVRFEQHAAGSAQV